MNPDLTGLPMLAASLPGLAAAFLVLATRIRHPESRRPLDLALALQLTAMAAALAGYPAYRPVAFAGAIASLTGPALILVSARRRHRNLLLPGLAVFLLQLLQSAVYLGIIVRMA